jgi:hypothetical protein
MLKYPPELRLTAQQAYTHDWIKKKNFNPLKPEATQALLANLTNFHVRISSHS